MPPTRWQGALDWHSSKKKHRKCSKKDSVRKLPSLQKRTVCANTQNVYKKRRGGGRIRYFAAVVVANELCSMLKRMNSDHPCHLLAKVHELTLKQKRTPEKGTRAKKLKEARARQLRIWAVSIFCNVLTKFLPLRRIAEKSSYGNWHKRTFRRQTITASTPTLLIISFDRLRQAIMNNGSDILQGNNRSIECQKKKKHMSKARTTLRRGEIWTLPHERTSTF